MRNGEESDRSGGHFGLGREIVPVIPRHAASRRVCQQRRIPVQLGEIVEGIGAAEFGGVNQAHEQVAYSSSIFGSLVQPILAMHAPLFYPSPPHIVLYTSTHLPPNQ